MKEKGREGGMERGRKGTEGRREGERKGVNE